MSQSATWDALQVARDARLCGRTDDETAILAAVAPDFEYLRRSGVMHVGVRDGQLEVTMWGDDDAFTRYMTIGARCARAMRDAATEDP